MPHFSILRRIHSGDFAEESNPPSVRIKITSAAFGSSMDTCTPSLLTENFFTSTASAGSLKGTPKEDAISRARPRMESA